jgi:hypothetical protein
MSISVSTIPVDYIPEADAPLSPQWQTVYRIRPKTAAMEARNVAKYAQARESRGGKEKVDPDRLLQAELSAFCEIVESVTNFLLRADDFDPGASPKEAALFGLNGETKKLTTSGGIEVYSVNATDRNQLMFIASRLEADLRKEIDEASEKQSRLSEGARKK